MDPVLTTLDAALQTLDDVAAALPVLRAQATTIAAETAWESAAVAQYHRRWQRWDDDIVALLAGVDDEREELRVARAGRVVALAGAQ
ncbi:hypothetical protein ET475_05995 [Microbacterium protaetiae]|uniref:Uncharacterized protein n=1 Tax=Microbacterium protaetiae TaxID=2509458 RepID=A0A4P6EBK4_9MICO|nr:hypothetical protein [Microbacterium protaetiae]QAY59580.1 hypothetical protein ET475_05995 [Microbacterium protaetiae]